MSKSILVIDTPNACIECPCHSASMSLVLCGKENRSILTNDLENFMPDWCPLKEVPRKMSEEDRMVGKEYTQGYNDCIDELLKGDGDNATG